MFLLSSVLTVGLRPHLPVLLTPCNLSGPFNKPSALVTHWSSLVV